MNPSMRPANLSEGEIFDAALACSTPTERTAYLDQACVGQPELRQRVEALLAAHDQATGFLENPNARTNPNPTVRLELPGDERIGDVIGHYKIREKIGEGGCGVVYVADQEKPVRRRVALKVVKLGMDTKQVVARFEAERQALALMDHPNIAKVLDAGSTSTGRPFFVMELVRGIKITEYCDQNNLSTEERLKLFIQVCHAVQHAHQKGIIHRDLKPSNVLVTLHDGVPVPKVIDFGIAKATSDQRLTDKTIYTAFEQFLGTPAYMSPEQAEMSGLDIDTRSDIYSLGVLLYELLTGKTPFDPKTLMQAGIDQMRRIIREQEPPRPSTRLSTLTHADLTAAAKQRHAEAPRLLSLIRGDLDWIVMKCLEKDRTRRYDTANGLATEIQRHLSNEPVIARPPSALYRIQKTVRRNKLAVASAAVIGLVLFGGIIVSSWWAIQASRAKDETAKALVKAKLAQAAEGKERQRAEDEAKRADENAEQERAQRQAAEEAAVKSRKVLDFMRRMISASGGSYKSEVTVLEMLDDGAQKVDADFRNEKDVSAAVQYSVGFCYSKVGQWEQARKFLQRSLELQSDLGYDASNWERLTTAKELASVALSQGRAGETRMLCEWLQTSAREGKSINATNADERKKFHDLELWTIRKLVQACEAEGRFGEAKPLILELFAATKPPESNLSQLTEALEGLGMIALHEGRPAEAIEQFAKARKRQGSGNVVQKAWVDSVVGEAHLALGNYELAESLIATNLPVLEWRFTEGHFICQRAYRNMVQIYSKTGHPEKSAPFAKKLGSQTTEPTYEDSVNTLLAIGLQSQAESLARTCLLAREKTDPNSWQAQNARSVLGECLLKSRDHAGAESLLVSGYAGMKKLVADSPPGGHSQFKRAYDRLVRLYQETGRTNLVNTIATADELYEFAQKAMLIRPSNPNDVPTALLWYELAAKRNHLPSQHYIGRLYGDGNGVTPDKAIAAEWLEKAAESDNPWYQNDLGHRYQCGCSVNKNEARAAYWYRRADKNYRRLAEVNPPKSLNDLASFLATVGVAENRNGGEAVGFAEKAVALTNRKTAAYLNTLAAAYAEAGRFSEAVGVQKEALVLMAESSEKAKIAERLQLYESRKPYHRVADAE